MLKEDAKTLVLQEYRSWRLAHPSDDAQLFFAYLQKEKSHLLKFKASGDKWQVVNGWILNCRL